MKRLFLFTILLFLLAACGGPPMPSTTAAVPTEETEEMAVSSQPSNPVPDEMTVGQTVYAANCAECHGVNLEGEVDWKIQNDDDSFRSPPHDETGHTWHHSDEQLLEAIRLGGARFEGMNIGGTSDMPAFGESLTEGEITAVLTYIKSTWPDDIRERQWKISQ